MAAAAATTKRLTLREEIVTQTGIALPISAVYLFQFLSMLISQVVAGHISADALAAVALANFWANVTGNAPLVGLAFGCDSLLPQAIGAKNYIRAGHIAQRSTIALLAASLLILPLYFFAGDVFRVLRQQPEVVDIAATYSRWLSLSLPAMASFEVYKKLVNAAGIFGPPIILSGTALGVQAGIAYYLVYCGGTEGTLMSGKLDGAAVAYAVSMWWCVLGGCLHLISHRYWVFPRCCSRSLSADARSGLDSVESADLDDVTAFLSRGDDKSYSNDSSSSGSSSVRKTLLDDSKVDGAAVAAAPSPHDILDAALASPLTFASLFEGAGWAEFLGNGMPAVIMMVLEWGSFEVLAVIAGTISTPVQAAHA